MPGKNGLMCATHQVGSLTPLESHCCIQVVCASDRAKASAFVQESAKISGRKSDKDSREVVIVHRCPILATRTTPRQLTEEAFTPGEL